MAFEVEFLDYCLLELQAVTAAIAFAAACIGTSVVA